MRKRLITVSFLAAAAPFVLSGCSGSSSTTGDNGPQQPVAETVAAAVTKGSSTVVADKISVLDASENSSAGKATAKRVALLTSEFPTTAEWNKDKTNTYIQDRSTEVFNNVNEILCMVGQTGYVAMTSTDGISRPYKALIDKNLCKGADSASKAGDSTKGDTSSSSAPDYREWIVDSIINSAGKLEAKFWIHEKDEGQGPGSKPAQVINAKLVVSKTKDEAPPYGLFRIDFRAYTDDSSHTPIFKGLLETVQDATTGQVTLRFADADDNNMFSEAASVTKDSATSGNGRVKQSQMDGNPPTLRSYDANIAFNADYFRRTTAGGAEDKCFDRKNFESSAWRYGLYDFTTGNRFTVKSGIPFNTNADGNSGAYGWIGYYGIWSNGVTLANPQTVYSKNFSNNTVETYVINTYPGKLKKHTKSTTTLDAIKNIPFEGYNEGSTMYRVIWDGTKLQKVASAAQVMGGPPAWTDISAQNLTIDTTHLQFGELNFWSQALGGQVRIKLEGCTFNAGVTSCTAPTGTTTVVFYTEDIIYPGDAILAKTLTCFDNCPKATSSQGMSYDSTTHQPSTYQQNFAPGFAGHNYSISNMVLNDTGSSSWPAVLTTTDSVNTWGFNSGAMFENTQANLDLLACDWTNPITGQKDICGWKAWSLPVFYTWETGPNDWSKLATVTKGGVNVTFDPPVKVEYTHSQTVTTAKDYKYNGVKFFLDYNGFGQLNGIPGKCIDTSTGLEALDCNGSNKRYVPEFSIPSGSTVKNGSTTYYVKALDIEQRMVKKDASVCTTAGVTAPTATITLPNVATDAVDPAIGTEPAAEVKVIGGIIQK
jgi:hypothetical protein